MGLWLPLASLDGIFARMSNIEDVGVAIHVLRVIRDLSQGQLAEASGVRNSSISNYERGKSVPKLETVQKLADGLGLPLSVVEETQAFIDKVRRRLGETAAGKGGGVGLWMRSSAGAGLPFSRDSVLLRTEVDQLSEEFGRLASRLIRLVLARLAIDDGELGGPVPPAEGNETTS